MKENKEQDWVESAQQGESAAIAELYRRYWRAARATAYGVTGDLGLAEDATSEALYTALGSLQDLRDSQRFGPWLHTIVVRIAGRLKTAQSKETVAELQTLPDVQSIEPCVNLEQRELVALIHEAVGNLSEILREAISLFYFEGYTVEQAACFLDIPAGTLKRRLHDGRHRLHDIAVQILEGRKPMNLQREQILQQLRDTMDEGIHSDTFYQAIRQALRLRPVPQDLLQKIAQKHWAGKHKKKSMSAEKEHQLRQTLSNIYNPSQRFQDKNHPVGSVANAIRAELPEFQLWQFDWSEVDLSQVTRDISEGNQKALSFLRPTDFNDGSEGSYLSGMRAWLLQDEDGSVCTGYGLMQKNSTLDTLKRQIKHGKRLSDSLHLLWKKSDILELRAVEVLLRRLSDAIVPATPVRFCSYEEPRYRSALRMQLGDNPIPAAIGGVLNSLPGLPDRVKVASVLIYLEPWATARSGQIIELAELSPLLDPERKKQTDQ